jgi:RNA polymerase sigma factor (sigma-70 family)
MAEAMWSVRLDEALDSDNRQAARRAVPTAVATDRDLRDSVLDLLAQRAAEGSPVACELLVTLVDELGLARTGVRQWLVDESAVDDVAQDTLISMARSVGSFTGEARFVTWLFAIARHRSYDHLRRRRASEPLADDDVSETVRISSMIASQETVRRAVRQLPDQHRQAVELREIDQLPYAEIAERLGLNVNTARSHVARGRAQLAALLGPAGA